MTGMTLTRGERRRISSISISLKLTEIVRRARMIHLDGHARVTRGRDKVEEGVNTVVPEAGVTLDTRLLGQDVVVLAFEVADDLLESKNGSLSSNRTAEQKPTYANSLSMLSPNPGVSTMVRAMRTPSSSSSVVQSETRAPRAAVKAA